MVTKTGMKRWVLKAGTKDLSGLVLEDAPMPEPGPGQVRIRVRATSVNYRDQLILKGTEGVPLAADMVPLSDGAGEIDAVGPGVERWSVGDRVAGLYFKGWVDGPPLLGMGWGLGSPGQQGGMLAEYVVLDADRIATIPTSLNFLEASTLPCAALTAWTALNGDLPYPRRVGKGDKVLVLGTGGVSLFALLLARAVGAEVFGTSSSEDKLAKLRKLGASDTVNYKTIPHWGEVIYERTGGVNRVVNAAGAGSMDQSIQALANGGEVAFMGLFTQADSAPNFINLMMKAGAIRGTAVGSAGAFNDLVEAVDKHGIKPPIDKTFGFEEAREAYQAQTSPNLFGKIVIEVVNS